MNPNYLAKDELLCQLKAHGITREGDTHLLRKLFRSVVTRVLPIDAEFREKFQVSEAWEEVVKKTCELQTLLSQTPKVGLLQLVPKVQSKVLHLRGRLRYIEEGQPGQQVDSARLEQNIARLEDIEGVITFTFQSLVQLPFPTSLSNYQSEEV
jgi:hypothetical protein